MIPEDLQDQLGLRPSLPRHVGDALPLHAGCEHLGVDAETDVLDGFGEYAISQNCRKCSDTTTIDITSGDPKCSGDWTTWMPWFRINFVTPGAIIGSRLVWSSGTTTTSS